jgi:hypothetical protein
MNVSRFVFLGFWTLVLGPHRISPSSWTDGKIFIFFQDVSQLDCLELATSHGVRVSPGQLVLAASFGDLELVRYFHSVGFPVWHTAIDEFTDGVPSDDRSWDDWVFFVKGKAIDSRGGAKSPALWDGVLHLPPWDEALPDFWDTLRFGHLHGAPLTARAEALVQERRACAQEVVRCFHAARWRAAAGGRSSAEWAAMAAVPPEVLMKIMEVAEVEIQEALP